MTLDQVLELLRGDPKKFFATLKTAVEAEPVAFVGLLGTALKAAREGSGVEVSRKFFWGETGVEQNNDPWSQIQRGEGGDAIERLIAAAISGVSFDKIPAGAGQLRTTMRSVLIEIMKEELKSSLAPTLLESIQNPVADAIVGTVKGLMESSSPGLSFDVPNGNSENAIDPYRAENPS